MAGIANAVIALASVQATVVLLAYPQRRDPDRAGPAWLLAAVLLVLGTTGACIGRFVRANSWDLLNPARLARTLAEHLRQPGLGRHHSRLRDHPHRVPHRPLRPGLPAARGSNRPPLTTVSEPPSAPPAGAAGRRGQAFHSAFLNSLAGAAP